MKKLIQVFHKSPSWIFPWALRSQAQGGTRPKTTIRLSHQMRLVPRSTALIRWYCHLFPLTKILQDYLKKSQITSPQPLSVVDLWKHPLFLDFTMQVQLVKNSPKTLKMVEPTGGVWSSPPPLGSQATHSMCQKIHGLSFRPTLAPSAIPKFNTP